MTAKDGYVVVRWADDSWSDFIPWDDLAREGVVKRFEHSLSPPRGKQREKAFCRLTVKGARAIFDYSAFERLNNQSGCEIGVMRFVFDSAAREKIISIDWKEKSQNEFWENAALAREAIFPPPQRYVKQSGKQRKRIAEVQARDGQGDFRREMLKVYGGKCAVSDCMVEDVLEGAHIDVFSEGSSHNSQNGLLMRCDLHALFDADLLGIEPNTHIIHIAEVARSAPYDILHKNRTLRSPMGGVSYLPSQQALARRWKAYLKANIE